MLYHMLLKVVLNSQNYAKAIGVKMGKGCYISTKNFSSEPYLIEIGENVRIAKKVSFFTHEGVWTLRKKYNLDDLDYFGKIKIGNNTYIGESVIILAGANIGENCIIGAGSVVSKSVPNNVVAAGNPLVYVSNIHEYLKKKVKINLSTKNLSLAKKKKLLLKLDDNKFVSRSKIPIP